MNVCLQSKTRENHSKCVRAGRSAYITDHSCKSRKPYPAICRSLVVKKYHNYVM